MSRARDLADGTFSGAVTASVDTTGDFNFYATSDGGGAYRIYPDDATTANPVWLHQSNSSEPQSWVIGGVERMRLDGDNLGINTTDPQTKFVVSASDSENIEISGSWIQSFNRSGSPGYASLPFYASDYTFNNGAVSKPAQPAFRAGRDSNYTAGTYSDIVFNNTASGNFHFNIGSHYNSSNGKFTCPVAGRYIFYAQVIYGPGLTDGQDMDDAFYIYKNGTRTAFSARRSDYVAGTTGNSGYYIDHANTILNCSVNDYVTIHNRRSLPVHGNPTYCFFYGYFLG